MSAAAASPVAVKTGENAAPVLPASISTVPVSDEPISTSGAAGFDHRVTFYDSDAVLYEAATDFFQPALAAGEPVVVVATDTHRAGLIQNLAKQGFDIAALTAEGRLITLDAQSTLDSFMDGDLPDPARFAATVGSLVKGLKTKGHVHAYGEMVSLLWHARKAKATVCLEGLWNELGASGGLSLLCGYSISHTPSRDEAARDQALRAASRACTRTICRWWMTPQRLML